MQSACVIALSYKSMTFCNFRAAVTVFSRSLTIFCLGFNMSECHKAYVLFALNDTKHKIQPICM